ncbi:hypothetical protein FQR65_LT14703 [Abscondita terminalis]|nr:hypothetical protein FQR65_LT14703 [Abscondita terminalis]
MTGLWMNFHTHKIKEDKTMMGLWNPRWGPLYFKAFSRTSTIYHQTMFTRTLLVLLLLLSVQAKIYDRCELALELVHVHKVSRGDLSTLLCILYHESRFDTKAYNENNGEHGIFQIGESHWCSPPGKTCGMTCNSLKNDDIRDDVNCARIMFQEYQRISGDGFIAWKVYPLHCKDKNYVATFIKGCNLYRAENGNANTTMVIDYQKEDKGNSTNKSPISLRTLPKTEKTEIVDQPLEQLSEFRIKPITNQSNFKPTLHLLASKTDKNEE